MAVSVTEVPIEELCIDEYQELRVSAESCSRIAEVVSAKYGKGDNWADVTDIVKHHVTPRGTIDSLRVGNGTLGCDPFPGVKKELIVRFLPADIEVPIKLQVKRGTKTVQYRRVRLSQPIYSVIMEMVRGWVNGQFKLQYIDSDGDDITVCSQPEWLECIRLWRTTRHKTSAPLRLICLMKAEKATTTTTTPVTVEAERYGTAVSVSPSGPQARTEQEVVSAVLDWKHGPHALARLSTGALDGKKAADTAGGWLQVRKVGDGCDLDINLPMLSASLGRQGLDALDKQTYDDAAMFFAWQAELSPNATAEYNHACALALAGESVGALLALDRAISLGYADAHHLMNDPDLSSLHSLDGWQACVGNCGGNCPDTRTKDKTLGKKLLQAIGAKDLKQQEKAAKKEEKQQEKELRREEKRLEKEFKQQEKELKKEEKRLEKEMKKEEKRQEKEIKKEEKRQEKELKKEEKRAALGAKQVDCKKVVCSISDESSSASSDLRTASPASAVEGVVVEHPRFAAQLRMLHTMGYDNDDLSIDLLERFDGDVRQVVSSLID